MKDVNEPFASTKTNSDHETGMLAMSLYARNARSTLSET